MLAGRGLAACFHGWRSRTRNTRTHTRKVTRITARINKNRKGWVWFAWRGRVRQRQALASKLRMATRFLAPATDPRHDLAAWREWVRLRCAPFLLVVCCLSMAVVCAGLA